MNRALGVLVAVVMLLTASFGCDPDDADLLHMTTGARNGGGTDAGFDPGQDPGVDPGLDPGLDPGVDDTSGGTGTWYDSVSGLTWQNPSPSGYKNWNDAKSYCASLSLAGGGGRLPTNSELWGLIRGCSGAQTGGRCRGTDSCLSYSSCRDSSCNGCPTNKGPTGGCYWPGDLSGTCTVGTVYWSSSPVADHADGAFFMDFGNGYVDSGLTTGPNGGFVRCVR